MTARCLGTVDAPPDSAAAAIHGDHERSSALIADQHHQVADDDWRRTHPVGVGERAEWNAPSLASDLVVCEEPDILKEDVDVLTIGRRRWRCRMVPFVDGLLPGPFSTSLPGDGAGLPFEGNGQERVAIYRRQKNVALGKNR